MQPIIIVDCIYKSYRYNRLKSPEIPVEDWTLIFGSATWDYEKRLKEELAIEKLLDSEI